MSWISGEWGDMVQKEPLLECDTTTPKDPHREGSTNTKTARRMENFKMLLMAQTSSERTQDCDKTRA